MRYGCRIETSGGRRRRHQEEWKDVPSIEVVLFLAMALLIGGLTMGGVTLVYFLDKWRADPKTPAGGADRGASPFDRAA
jgi:hypothetical protein